MGTLDEMYIDDLHALLKESEALLTSLQYCYWEKFEGCPTCGYTEGEQRCPCCEREKNAQAQHNLNCPLGSLIERLRELRLSDP
jgi:hypothetical protein